MPERIVARLRIDGVDSVVLVTEYHCEEGISQLFAATIEIACEADHLSFDAVALRPTRLSIHGLGGVRHIHGIVTRLEYLRTGRNYTFYRLTVAPHAHRLALRKDMRIFQRRTVPEIAREVLLAAGLHADEFRLDIVRDHPQRDYCVQYRETDLAFFHRILAREGIFYFFEHSETVGVLVIADHPRAHTAPPGMAAPLRHDDGFSSTRERLLALRTSARLCPGKATLRDFNPLHPSTPLEVGNTPTLDKDFEIYDFPGGCVEEGLPFLQLGADAVGALFGQMQSGRDGSEGESDCPLLTAGHTLGVAGSPRKGQDGEYVVTRLTHTGKQPGLAQVDAQEPGSYSNSFCCIPAGAPVPLPQTSERPQIPSIQSAIVVGPGGQPIYTDKLGRIKIQFHWDRQGKRNEHSSCWVRVASPWGGSGHGLLSTPRIGSEVAVAFLEGDPDRPLVLGCLYSADNEHPNALPAGQTRSTWRSRSTTGDGYNELCFEDNAGEEQVLLHAERDYSVHVQRDSKTSVDHCEHTTVKADRAAKVGADHLTVLKDRIEQVGGNSFTTVAGTLVLAAGSLVLQVSSGGGLQSSSDLGIAAEGALTMSAARGLCIKGTGGFIMIDEQGVHIGGTKIFLNGSGLPFDTPAPPVPKHDPLKTPTPAEDP